MKRCDVSVGTCFRYITPEGMKSTTLSRAPRLAVVRYKGHENTGIVPTDLPAPWRISPTPRPHNPRYEWDVEVLEHYSTHPVPTPKKMPPASDSAIQAQAFAVERFQTKGGHSETLRNVVCGPVSKPVICETAEEIHQAYARVAGYDPDPWTLVRIESKMRATDSPPLPKPVVLPCMACKMEKDAPVQQTASYTVHKVIDAKYHTCDMTVKAPAPTKLTDDESNAWSRALREKMFTLVWPLLLVVQVLMALLRWPFTWGTKLSRSRKPKP